MAMAAQTKWSLEQAHRAVDCIKSPIYSLEQSRHLVRELEELVANGAFTWEQLGTCPLGLANALVAKKQREDDDEHQEAS